jgi:Cysteine-rich CPCC
MIQLSRTWAIDIISKIDLLFLTEESRYNILVDIFSENDEYEKIGDIFQEKLNDEIIDYLTSKYIGVTNYYLSYCIEKYLNISCNIIGNIEILLPCPCCNYKTLPELGEHNICEICYWESDKVSTNIDYYSSANRSTLSDYKQKFNSEKKTTIDLKKYLL